MKNRVQELQAKFNKLKDEHKEIDTQLKYRKQFHSAHQLKIYKERRAYLKKQIVQLDIQLQLSTGGKA